MDPLSITASILALTAAVHATAKGIREVGSMCKAPRLIEEISNELRYLELLLRQIENFNYNNRHLGHVDVLLDPLVEAKKRVDRFNGLLPKPAKTRLGKATRNGLSWVVKKHDLLELRNDLHFIKIDLILGLVLVSS